MDEDERAKRKEDLAGDIRARQAELGHEGPTPAFLSVLMDKVVDDEERFEQLERRLAALEREVWPT